MFPAETRLGLAMGSMPPLRIMGRMLPGADHGGMWFAREVSGLIQSAEPNPALRSAQVMFAICEWHSEEEWGASKPSTD